MSLLTWNRLAKFVVVTRVVGKAVVLELTDKSMVAAAANRVKPLTCWKVFMYAIISRATAWVVDVPIYETTTFFSLPAKRSTA